MHLVAEKPSAAPIRSITWTAKVGPLVEDKVFASLQQKSAPQHKAVSEKDVSSSQYKAASHKFRFYVLWAC